MGVMTKLGDYRRIAVDTNIFITIFAKEPMFEKVKAVVSLAADENKIELIASVLAYAECLAVPLRYNNQEDVEQIRLAFQMPNLYVCPMNSEVAVEAASLRAKYGFKMPDAIHLATALTCEADCFLTNDRRLVKCEEIKVLSLEEL